MAYCFSTNLDSLDEKRYSFPLPDEDRARETKLRSPLLRQRFRRSRLFLRSILAAYLNQPPQSIRFATTRFGKPYLPDNDLRFNLSHSCDECILAINWNGPIGVDIEALRQVPDREALIKRFMYPGELEEYRSLAVTEKNRGFLNLWTRKEAILKAIGAGLQIPLDSFQVTLDPRRPCRVVSSPGVDSKNDWRLLPLPQSPTLVGALAVRAPKAEAHWIRLIPDSTTARDRQIKSTHSSTSTLICY